MPPAAAVPGIEMDDVPEVEVEVEELETREAEGVAVDEAEDGDEDMVMWRREEVAVNGCQCREVCRPPLGAADYHDSSTIAYL
jgi:hypothetical protein